jgi:hypothetical protein
MKDQLIPKESIIHSHLPADYVDTHSKEIQCERRITPEAFLDMAFNQHPKWIVWLLELRNILVKPFGLDTKSRFTDMNNDKSLNEIVFGMTDKHLTFYVSLWCGEHQNNKQLLKITTVVKYNNTLGKLYFAVIKPFHCVIIKTMLRRVGKLASKKR